MRFGCCAGPEQVEIVARAGFDFCELPARVVLPFDDDAAALPALRALGSAAVPLEAFNVLVPAELPLVGPRADHDALRRYLRRAFTRMVSLGGAVVILGSGAARRIPADMSRERALDQLADALALAGDEARRAGIEIALEHLNQAESNVFTSLAECQAFVEQRRLTDLRLLADLFHLEVEAEPLDVVVAAGALLAHVHVADGERRPPGQGGYNYAGFMASVRATGYDRRISAECRWDDLEAEAPAALHFMRASWEAASAV